MSRYLLVVYEATRPEDHAEEWRNEAQHVRERVDVGELRLAQTGMRCDIRCDGPLRLYADEIEKILRANHYVTGNVEKHGV